MHLIDLTPLLFAISINFCLVSIVEFVLSITTFGFYLSYNTFLKYFNEFASEPKVSLFILK